MGHRERDMTGDTTFKAPPGQRSTQVLPTPGPAFAVRPHSSKVSPAWEASPRVSSRCAFPAQTLQSGTVSALSRPSALTDVTTTTQPHSSADTGSLLPQNFSWSHSEDPSSQVELTPSKVPPKTVGEVGKVGDLR